MFRGKRCTRSILGVVDGCAKPLSLENMILAFTIEEAIISFSKVGERWRVICEGKI